MEIRNSFKDYLGRLNDDVTNKLKLIPSEKYGDKRL